MTSSNASAAEDVKGTDEPKRLIREPVERIRVRAFRPGEYGLIMRNPGDVFDVVRREVATQNWLGDDRDGDPLVRIMTAEEQFSPEWMREVPPDTPERQTSGQEALTKTVEQLIIRAS